ncbi:MAG: hypothetical protein EOP50_11980, partial [Sphingobacteriales bacterium]
MRLKKHVLAMLGCLILFSSLAQQGSIDPYFNTGTGFNGRVNGITEQPDHKILVGGDFTSYDGQAVAKIVRLNTDGSLDPTFTAASVASGEVRVIALQSDGKVLVGGSFTAYAGTAANRLVRLNADGSLDMSFLVGTGFAAGSIYSIIVEPDGQIVVSGTNTTYKGTTNTGAVRLLNSDGTQQGSAYVFGNSGQSDGESTTPVGHVFALSEYTSNRYVAAGNFVATNLSPNYNRMVVVGAGSGGAVSVSSGSMQFNNIVSCVVKQPDGKYLVGGMFTNGARIRLARFTIGTVYNLAFDANFITGTGVTLTSGNAIVRAMALQPDGNIFIAGDFDTYNGTAASRIARLGGDGVYDASFAAGTGFDARTNAVALQTNGNLLVGGYFGTYNGTTANRLVRLQAADRSISTTLSASAFCTGGTVSVPFTATNSFANDNVFTAQLSDGSGSFANPVVIGSVTDAYSGTISATLPVNSAAGSGYRIRVVSSNPVFTGTDNGSDLSMSVAPPATFTYPASP